MSDYIIVGDTAKYKECLVCVCGTKDNAEKILDRMLNDPNANDRRLIEGHTNLRIEEVPRENCWWRYSCD